MAQFRITILLPLLLFKLFIIAQKLLVCDGRHCENVIYWLTLFLATVQHILVVTDSDGETEGDYDQSYLIMTLSHLR